MPNTSIISHPVAICQEANALYWAWVRVPNEKIYRKEFQDAKARYQLHLWNCQRCREGIGEYESENMPELR